MRRRTRVLFVALVSPLLLGGGSCVIVAAVQLGSARLQNHAAFIDWPLVLQQGLLLAAFFYAFWIYWLTLNWKKLD